VSPRGAWIVVALTASACATASVREPAPATAPVEPSPPEPPLTWDAATGALDCQHGEATLAVPQDLRAKVVLNGDSDATILLAARGILVFATVSAAPSFDLDDPLTADATLDDFFKARVAEMTKVLVDLHGKLTGLDLRQEGVVVESPGTINVSGAAALGPGADPTFPANDNLFTEYTVKTPPGGTWRAVLIRTDRCQVAAIDRANPSDDLRLTRLLDKARDRNGTLLGARRRQLAWP